MARASTPSPAPSSWPFNLQRKYRLELARGDFFVLDGVQYVVVGFDGRHEGYICWRRGPSGAFDTSDLATVERTRLPKAWMHPPPDDGRGFALRAKQAPVPPLPELDHTGRVLGARSRTPARTLSKEAAALVASPQKAATPRRPAMERLTSSTESLRATPSFAPSPTKPRPPPAHAEAAAERGGRPAPGAMADLGDFAECTQRLVEAWRAEEEPVKTCFARAWCRAIAGSVTGAFSHLAARLARLQCRLSHPALPDRAGAAAPAGGDIEGLQIIIPVVRPRCWEEVRPFVDAGAVAFDESGWKETMTVRYSRWAAFVDRQRSRLEAELCDLRRGGGEESSQSSAEEGATDMERLLASMGDWKDVSRFSGRSVSMGSTQTGSEMRLHVVAFAERSDEVGIDFVRISYKKSVEVPAERLPDSRLDAAAGPGAEDWGRRVRLLQRPDVARFAIALAFRGALARDGVHLEICEAPEGER